MEIMHPDSPENNASDLVGGMSPYFWLPYQLFSQN